MSWFFGKRSEEDDDEYESYTDSEDEDESLASGDEEGTASDDEEEGEEEDASSGVEKEETDEIKKDATVPEEQAKNDENESSSENDHEAPSAKEDEPPPAEDDESADPANDPHDKENVDNSPVKSYDDEATATTTTTTPEKPSSENPVMEEDDDPADMQPSKEATDAVDDGNSAEKEEPQPQDDKHADEPKEEEEEEEVTSMQDKRSLLTLAAEHDRVDILKAILADAQGDEKHALLNTGIPPLHIAIAYGSTNATQCLLRMGADPSVRPNVTLLQQQQQDATEGETPEIPNMQRFHQRSVWELAFGKDDTTSDIDEAPKSNSSWFGGGSSKKKHAIDIAPSKVEGIRHAFTAEALRCIGSDEAPRLAQLIASGMPSSIDIGGKHLYDWAVEMGALQCEELLRSTQEETNETGETKEHANDKNDKTLDAQRDSAVLDRPVQLDTVAQLNNRLAELEALAQALSSCLDNLAEEVSVCHGLLLMGGGASALASHVRSLKTMQRQKSLELERMQEAYENSQDELAYWVREAGPVGQEIASAVASPTDLIVSKAMEQLDKVVNASNSKDGEEDQSHVRQQLQAQVAASENKVCKLRASIADLSEENTRDLEEVENRGLSGGIKLVRGLRDELRELDFHLNETKSAEALCRAKIKLIQAKTSSTGGIKKPTNGNNNEKPVSSAAAAPTAPKPVQATENGKESNRSIPNVNSEDEQVLESASSIESGQSTAIALRNESSHGYFTVDLWRILLRIIGLGSSSSSRYDHASATTRNAPSPAVTNIMIV